MIYNILYFFIILLLPFNQEEKGLFGEISNFNQEENMKAYLLQVKKVDDFYNGSSFLVIDSAIIDQKGFFHFPNFNELDPEWVCRINFIKEGEAPGKIVRDYMNNNYIFLVNENKPIEIKCTLPALSRNYSIKNPSTVNQYFQKVLNSEDSIYIKIQNFITTQIDEQLTAEESKLLFFNNLKCYVENELFQPIKKEINEAKITDPRLLAFLIQHFEYDYNSVDDVIEMNRTISKANQMHPYIEDIMQNLDNSVFPNAELPNLVLSSINGKNIDLADIDAEIILIDFWASWCSPCRDENRNVVKPLYQQYKNKGLEVIGINLDDDYEKWQNAVEQDGTDWIHVGDTLGKKSPLFQTYKIESLPTTYLLDRNKKVIRKNLRGENLNTFIKNYFEVKGKN